MSKYLSVSPQDFLHYNQLPKKKKKKNTTPWFLSVFLQVTKLRNTSFTSVCFPLSASLRMELKKTWFFPLVMVYKTAEEWNVRPVDAGLWVGRVTSALSLPPPRRHAHLHHLLFRVCDYNMVPQGTLTHPAPIHPLADWDTRRELNNGRNWGKC